MLSIATYLLLIFPTAGPLDEAFAILSAPSASYEEIRAACAFIDSACTNDDPQCVARLLAVWEDLAMRRSQSPVEALLLGCSKSGEATLPLVLDAVRRLLRAGTPEAKDRATQFFGQAIERLAERVTDPEPLLELAAEWGCLRTITRIRSDPELRERHLIQGLRHCDELCSPSFTSIACYTSETAAPELRRLMRELAETAPSSRGLDVAVRTLVELEDSSMLGDLESMLADHRFSQEQRDACEVYLAKFHHEHDPEALLRIVRTETENKRLLMWAVRRLLWLKTDKKTIRQALAAPRPLSSVGRQIAREISLYVFPDHAGASTYSISWDSDSLMLDREELREACSAATAEPPDIEGIARYSLGALLRDAPPGE